MVVGVRGHGRLSDQLELLSVRWYLCQVWVFHWSVARLLVLLLFSGSGLHLPLEFAREFASDSSAGFFLFVLLLALLQAHIHIVIANFVSVSRDWWELLLLLLFLQLLSDTWLAAVNPILVKLFSESRAMIFFAFYVIFLEKCTFLAWGIIRVERRHLPFQICLWINVLNRLLFGLSVENCDRALH